MVETFWSGMVTPVALGMKFNSSEVGGGVDGVQPSTPCRQRMHVTLELYSLQDMFH